MILLDVNVLVYAARREFSDHGVARAWLTTALSGTEPVAVTDEVLAATVRLLTNHRVLADPLDGESALEFCRLVREAPATVLAVPESTRWSHFARLVTELGLRANDIPDALLAATALQLNATLATFDRGFRRFPRLPIVIPGPSTTTSER